MKNYLPGDFSFKPNSYIFEYDYNIVNKLGDIAWKYLKNHDNTKYNYINEIINTQLCQDHTYKTRQISLSYLKFIAINGWGEFVKSETI